MKNKFLNSIKIIALAAILAAGVSYVSAWNAPSAPATNGNTIAAVNTSDFGQTKVGSFTSELFLKAGGTIAPAGALWANAGYIVAEKAVIAPWGFFKKSFLPGTGSQVKIGSPITATPTEFNGAVTPFTIDLIGRGTANNSPSGRQVVDLRADDNMCYPNTTIRTNTPGIEFLNSKTGDNADVIARQVQLSGGNPAAGMILVSTDKDGNAVWGTPTLVGGQIAFTYGTSPAKTGQALCSNPPNPIPGCTDPTADNYNVDATVNNNSCTYTIPVCTDPNAIGTADDGSCIYFNDNIERFDIGCFIENTKITMADGAKKNIEDVKVGDKLKAVDGINTVQKLLRPKLKDQSVYNINGSDAFFTANHPFLTTSGWKSLDPETTHKEIPSLIVTQMKVGDVLITESKNVTIRSVEKTSKPADTQLYNFELDGDHTYYANGYAVHNKEAVPYFSPNPSCDLNPSTSMSDCTELNNYYCKISQGQSQGQCIPSKRCTSDTICKSGPTIGVSPNQIQLVNGRCLLPTSWVHPADEGKKFCKW